MKTLLVSRLNPDKRTRGFANLEDDDSFRERFPSDAAVLEDVAHLAIGSVLYFATAGEFPTDPARQWRVRRIANPERGVSAGAVLEGFGWLAVFVAGVVGASAAGVL